MTAENNSAVCEPNCCETETQETFIVQPATDILKNREDGTVQLVLDVPGLDDEHLDVSVKKNVLVIEGAIPATEHDGFTPLFSESNATGFRRVFTLTDAIDRERIDASIVDGVLTVTLPLVEKYGERKIEVRSGSRAE